MLRDINKEVEDGVYRRKWVNDWLHDYGLDIEDSLNAGDIEELCEQMITDRDKKIKSKERKRTLEEVRVGLECLRCTDVQGNELVDVLDIEKL